MTTESDLPASGNRSEDPFRGNGLPASSQASETEGQEPPASEAEQTASGSDQTAADNDQTAADADHTSADADQNRSDSDQQQSNRDQRASERDQAAADHELAVTPTGNEGFRHNYERSRDDRETSTLERDRSSAARAESAAGRLAQATARDDAAGFRDESAKARDQAAGRRDRAAEARDRRAAEHAVLSEAEMSPGDRELHRAAIRHAGSAGEHGTSARAQAAAGRSRAVVDRERAAADREQAARDRSEAARDREESQAELHFAHLDELTGAYRRAMGRAAIQHEIDRARRGDENLVLAFVDVNGLKRLNDESGHAAGDEALRAIVGVLRSRLRSYEPLVRLGGDEFVFTLAGAGFETATTRLGEILAAVDRELKRSNSLDAGLAELLPTDTLDALIDRADAELVASR
jgi:diguanylate cyclase (GGDEF)-like protein